VKNAPHNTTYTMRELGDCEGGNRNGVLGGGVYVAGGPSVDFISLQEKVNLRSPVPRSVCSLILPPILPSSRSGRLKFWEIEMMDKVDER
jgi:hypothetical protein